MSDPVRRHLSLLARSHCNSKCADCRARAPTQGHSELGLFLCAACADVHRAVHAETAAAAVAAGAANASAASSAASASVSPPPSVCRSLMYDPWFSREVARMEAVGNLKSNERLEATMGLEERILSDATPRAREAFIRAKYVARRWFGDAPAASASASAADSSAAASASPPPAALLSSSPDSASSSASSSSDPPIGRAAKRRERLNRLAVPCALDAAVAQEEKRRHLDRQDRADREGFDPALARVALGELYARAYPGSGAMPPVSSTLSAVLTTSAVPSNPSLHLVQAVLGSVARHCGLQARPREKVAVVVAMDGYAFDPSCLPGTKPKFKNGKLDAGAIEAYERFKVSCKEWMATQPFEQMVLIPLELPFRHGFAGAVYQSLGFTAAEFVFVLQHDWCFVRGLDHSLWQIIQTMEANPPTDEFEGDGNATEEDESAEGATDEAASAAPTTTAPPPLLPLVAASTVAASAASPVIPSAAPLPLNYITFHSSTTLRYLEKDFHFVAKSVGPSVHRVHHYEVQGDEDMEAAVAAAAATAEAAAEEGEEEKGEHRADASAATAPSSAAVSPSSSVSAIPYSLSPIPLCPVYFLFDRNHLVRTSFYRRHVFGAYRFMRSAAFIEDTFGQIMLNNLRGTSSGSKLFSPRPFRFYAAFVYNTDGGAVPHLDHVHGRKFMTREQHSLQYGERNDGARRKIEERQIKKGAATHAQAEAKQSASAAADSAAPVDDATQDIALDSLYLD